MPTEIIVSILTGLITLAGVLYYLATSTEPAETHTYAGGVGGAGTAGSNGGAGCVLLFYSLPRKEK